MLSFFYTVNGDFMKVKVFDESHEKDLEKEINDFLSTGVKVLDIQYRISTSIFSEEQIFCFSALILYE